MLPWLLLVHAAGAVAHAHVRLASEELALRPQKPGSWPAAPVMPVGRLYGQSATSNATASIGGSKSTMLISGKQGGEAKGSSGGEAKGSQAPQSSSQGGPAECVSKTDFKFTSFSPHPWTLMGIPGSTDGQGGGDQKWEWAPGVTPRGFASKADWVIGTRPQYFSSISGAGDSIRNEVWGDTSKNPKTVFVQTDMVQAFATQLLPCISDKFVLITGDHDITLPKQVDKRWDQNNLKGETWQALVADSKILHIFSENLDTKPPGGKVTGIPLGVNAVEFPGQNGDHWLSKVKGASTISQKPLTAVNVGRSKEGGYSGAQFQDRRDSQAVCSGAWGSWCSNAEIDPEQFFDKIAEHSFILCVHGGGLDPSPKAWTALMAGVIPIIQHYAGDEGYGELPVVIVDDFTAGSITPEKLTEWRTQLAPYFEQADKRAAVVAKLKTDHWWAKVQSALAGGSIEGENIAIRAHSRHAIASL